jgi:hypothetical protein
MWETLVRPSAERAASFRASGRWRDETVLLRHSPVRELVLMGYPGSPVPMACVRCWYPKARRRAWRISPAISTVWA